MLVIRPNHKSKKIKLIDALGDWFKAQSFEEDYTPPKEYEGLSVEIKQLSKTVYLESMGKARDTGEGWRADVEIYESMSMLVTHGVAALHGLEDENGAIDMTQKDGVLCEEDLQIISDNGLLMDLWRIVRHYNELSAEEKKQFGAQAPQTLQS